MTNEETKKEQGVNTIEDLTNIITEMSEKVASLTSKLDTLTSELNDVRAVNTTLLRSSGSNSHAVVDEEVKVRHAKFEKFLKGE